MPVKPILNIHPGEWYLGAEYERLYTVLGSCVALVSWHPTLKVGGLCHYLLPSFALTQKTQMYDCRYAINALPKMKNAMLKHAPLTDFTLSLFGGGDMFGYNNPHSIGAKNIDYAQQWLAQENVTLQRSDIGGSISRSLIFSLNDGEIFLKRYSMNPKQRV